MGKRKLNSKNLLEILQVENSCLLGGLGIGVGFLFFVFFGPLLGKQSM